MACTWKKLSQVVGYPIHPMFEATLQAEAAERKWKVDLDSDCSVDSYKTNMHWSDSRKSIQTCSRREHFQIHSNHQ